MKRIRKVAETPVDETTGSIVDTTSIDDKTTNTYSARIIDESIDYAVSNISIPTKTSQLTNDVGYISAKDCNSLYKKLDGSNNFITLTGGDGNTTGYRLILQKQLGTWSVNRIVMSIVSRHQGSGILSIGVETYADISKIGIDGFFYGSTLSYTAGSWVHYYNSSTGVYSLFWKYSDYSNCYVTILNKMGFDNTIQNGTWMTSIDSSKYGTAYSIKMNGA